MESIFNLVNKVVKVNMYNVQCTLLYQLLKFKSKRSFPDGLCKIFETEFGKMSLIKNRKSFHLRNQNCIKMQCVRKICHTLCVVHRVMIVIVDF